MSFPFHLFEDGNFAHGNLNNNGSNRSKSFDRNSIDNINSINMSDMLRSIPLVAFLIALFLYLFPDSSLQKRLFRMARMTRYMLGYAKYLGWFAFRRIQVYIWNRSKVPPQQRPLRTRREEKEERQCMTFGMFVRRQKEIEKAQISKQSASLASSWHTKRKCTFHNFPKGTRAHFEPCAAPTRRPDYKSISSWYWNVEPKIKSNGKMQGGYVIRSSDHWSNNGYMIRNNWWTFHVEAYQKNPPHPDRWLTGRCKYDDMEFFVTYKIDFYNFYRATVAHYTPCPLPSRPPDFTSPSGSSYWDIDNVSVIRCSDHWSNTGRRIADCWWTYDQDAYTHDGDVLVGQCDYAQFVRHRGHPEAPLWGTLSVNMGRLQSLPPGTTLMAAQQEWRNQARGQAPFQQKGKGLVAQKQL